MKLEHEFYKLPLAFDVERLKKELSGFAHSAWQEHPSDYKGNLAIPLISVNGEINDDFAGPMRMTEHLQKAPYMQQVIAAFKSVCSRSRLMRLEGKHVVPQHSDINYHWWSRVRIHVPIVTTPDVIFHCGDQQVHMAPGEAWIFDAWKMHHVVNSSGSTRVHLVIDSAGSPDFWQMVEAAEVVSSCASRGNAVSPRLVDFRPGEKPRIRTEQFNVPVVMSAGEIEALVDGLIQDVCSVKGNDQDDLRRYLAVLGRFKAGWRSVWAVYGSDKTAWFDYETLVNKTREDVLSIDSHLLLSNDSSAPQVMCARVLEAAYNPQLEKMYAGPATGSGSSVLPDRTSAKTAQERVGRNSPCPCGSGKKYKRCHGA